MVTLGFFMLFSALFLGAIISGGLYSIAKAIEKGKHDAR